MSEQKIYTEREMVMRERAAFRAGGVRGAGDRNAYVSDIAAEAVRRFPLALITRPRVVTDPIYSDLQWRVADGLIGFHWATSTNPDWRHGDSFQITTDRIYMWAKLLANPTETVDEDISNV